MDNIKEHLKHELDPLNEEQLKKVAEYIEFLKYRVKRSYPVSEAKPEALGNRHSLEEDSQPPEERPRVNNNPDYKPTGEILTIEEIRSRYPREWVFIADTETDDAWNVYRGEVLAHSPDRDEIDQSMAAFRHIKSTAIEYTGPIPDDYALMFGCPAYIEKT